MSGNRIEKQYDFGGDLGGRIIRNRLWFYGAARNRYQGFSVLNSFKPDGSPALEEGESTWHTEKVSFQANPSHRFIGFSQWARKPETNQFTELNSYESRMRKIVDFHYAKGEWEGVRGNSFIASFQFGYIQARFESAVQRGRGGRKKGPRHPADLRRERGGRGE